MNVYSMIGLPCDCSGIGCPRSLNLMIAKITTTDDDHADEAGDQEDRPLQVVDLLGVVAGRIPGVLGGVLGRQRARRQRERAGAHEGEA